MCGRFSLSSSKEQIEQELHINVAIQYRPSYNIAPTQQAYVVTNEGPAPRMQYMTWGLIPHWSREGKNEGKLINARMEGIASKPSFRMPIRQRRCLVPVDSFYEWKREGTNKIPYRIRRKDEGLLVLGGIWDVWMHEEREVRSFSIITTPPNLEMQSVHTRMPFVLETIEQQQAWLVETNLNTILKMMHPLQDDQLEVYRVSQELNSPKNNYIGLHEAVPEPPKLF